MKMMAYRHPWIFEALNREVLARFFKSEVALARGLTDELVAYGLPCVWTNVDSGSQIFVRVVRDVAVSSVDVSVLVKVRALDQLIEISDALATSGVALVTATRDPDLLRAFSLRIIAAVNSSLGGGAPVDELALRV